jgi:hypothetical protein
VQSIQNAARLGFDRRLLPDPQAFFEAERLTLRGRGRWRTTRCQFHGGSDSMRINVESGGWCCMACGAHGGDALAYVMQRDGIDFVAAARRLGAWIAGPRMPSAEKPKMLSPRDAMEVIAAELKIVWIVVSDIRRGMIPSSRDWERFTVATGHIEALAMEYRQ